MILMYRQFLVKPELLLARLPIERPGLQLRLTRILLPLYTPHGRTAPSQLARLLALVKQQPQAATLMLRHSSSFATPAVSAKLLQLLLGATLSSAEPAEIVAAKSVAELPKRDAELSSQELRLFGALAALFDAVGPSLSQPSHLAARAALVEDFNDAAMCAPSPHD